MGIVRGGLVDSAQYRQRATPRGWGEAEDGCAQHTERPNGVPASTAQWGVPSGRSPVGFVRIP